MSESNPICLVYIAYVYQFFDTGKNVNVRHSVSFSKQKYYFDNMKQICYLPNKCGIMHPNLFLIHSEIFTILYEIGYWQYIPKTILSGNFFFLVFVFRFVNQRWF